PLYTLIRRARRRPPPTSPLFPYPTLFRSLVTATARVTQVARWWPHTHGASALYDVALGVDGVEVPLGRVGFRTIDVDRGPDGLRSEEHTSELQSRSDLVCRLLLEKKNLAF